MKQAVELFFTGALQVCLVAMNITFISHGYIIPMVITGFLISLVWTFNVKKIAFGGWKDRFCYATGAAVGTLGGYFISMALSKLIAG